MAETVTRRRQLALEGGDALLDPLGCDPNPEVSKLQHPEFAAVIRPAGVSDDHPTEAAVVEDGGPRQSHVLRALNANCRAFDSRDVAAVEIRVVSAADDDRLVAFLQIHGLRQVHRRRNCWATPQQRDIDAWTLHTHTDDRWARLDGMRCRDHPEKEHGTGNATLSPLNSVLIIPRSCRKRRNE